MLPVIMVVLDPLTDEAGVEVVEDILHVVEAGVVNGIYLFKSLCIVLTWRIATFYFQ